MNDPTQAPGTPTPPRSRPAGLVPLLCAAVLVMMVSALFRPALGRYFCSEDFPLLRSLANVSPWSVLWRDLTSPWLDTTFVRFWRPVTSFVLAVQVKVVGLDPSGLHALQLCWHLGNTLLVFRVSRFLFTRVEAGAPWLAAFWVALLFGAWPLQPNCASFLAGLSNLLHATAFLLALDGWLRFRAGGRRGWLVLSVAAFLVGLGAYEAAVMIPVALGAWHLCQPVDAPASGRRRGWWQLGLCFGLPLVGYFLLRRVLLGDFIGGYDSGVLGEEVGAKGFLAAPLRSLALLVHPHFQREATPAQDVLWCAAAYLAPLAVFLRWRARGRRRLAGAGLFALAWTALCVAPYLAQPVVPSTGRYWYLACLGPLWALMLVAAGLPGRGRGAFGLPVLLGTFLLWQHVPLLKQQVAWYLEAGRTAGLLHRELARLAEEVPEGRTVYVGNVPVFVRDQEHLPVAPVYWYGLHDSARPPFLAPGLDVVPLPVLRDGVPPALALAEPEAWVVGWHPARERLVSQDVAAARARAADLERLEVLEPADGAVLDAGVSEVPVQVPADPAWSLRLVVLSPAAFRVERRPPGGDQGSPTFELPVPLLLVHRQFHPDAPLLWWVEARDADGRLVATTPACRLRLTPDGKD